MLTLKNHDALSPTTTLVFILLTLPYTTTSANDILKQKGLSASMTYSYSEDFTKEDKAKYRLLETKEYKLLSASEVKDKTITMLLNGDQAKLAWHSTHSSTVAKPNEATLKTLRETMPKLAARYDHPEITIDSREIIIFDAQKNKNIHVKEKSTTSYNIDIGSVTTSKKLRQRVNSMNPSICKTMNSHKFRFPRLESPCATAKWIEKGYRELSERKEKLELSFRDKTQTNFISKTFECEYYGAPDTKNIKSSGLCIAIINNIPITIIDEARGNSSNGISKKSVIRHELLSLDFNPQFHIDTFNFEKNTVCGAPNYSSDRWVKC